MRTHLCFHGIGRCTTEREPGEAGYWITESLFLRVLDDVAGRSDVQLSFDDGNVSDVETALPALLDRGLTASFFVLAGRLEDAASLGPSDLLAVKAAGMTIGSHGWSHIPWRGLSDAEARRELVDARTAIQDAGGVTVTTAAMPLGRYDRRSLRQLRRAGYRTVYSSDRFPARAGSWLQARYSLTAADTRETVLAMTRARHGGREMRNLLASAAKRLR